MSNIIATPFGHELPYSALFSVPKKDATRRRPPNHFWEKAIAPPSPVPAAPDINALSAVPTKSTWFDDDTPALSDSGDEQVGYRRTRRPIQQKKSFARLRQIAFRAFVPKAGSNKSSTVVATEIVTQKQLSNNDPLAKNGHGSGLTIFNSWRVKTKGVNTQVRKLAAVVRHRVSSKSPEDQKPKTWEEYHRCYAAEEIDINDPPLPPMEPCQEQPSPFETKFYMPPNAEDEPVRQLVLNRLGVFGKNAFDSSDDAVAQAHARTQLAEKLEQEGQVPETLEQAWDHRLSNTTLETGPEAALPMIRRVQPAELVPQTLEQHPVFRKIVRQCREIFGTSISMLSVMTDERQIFLAESGLDGMREAPRALTVCSHTVLSGRKGFTILDTLNDWRFSSSPLVEAHAARFYAGVPLLAPNLDGSPESDQAACPIGTLCVVDSKPREAFGIEERKKLVYMAEYARREIEIWFKSKTAQKIAALEESRQNFIQEVRDVEGVEEGSTGQQTEVLELDTTANGSPPLNPEEARLRTKGSFGTFRSNRFLKSRPISSHSTASSAEASPVAFVPQGPSLFDDANTGLKPKIQTVFELATKLVGVTLELSLVYLLAVKPHNDQSNTGHTLILSAYNLPFPAPSFDAGLHLRALRAPEGGLLYQNPSPQEVQNEGLVSAPESNPYASAMLVRVGPEPSAKDGGFILGGFTIDTRRVFGEEDVTYMKHFASELERYTVRLRL